MDDGSAVGRLSFGGTGVGAGFEHWKIHIAPGSQRVFEAAEWRDTIVVVEGGALELETASGVRVAFAAGAVLCLGTWLRVLRNRGRVPVVLLAVARASDEFSRRGPLRLGGAEGVRDQDIGDT